MKGTNSSKNKIIIAAAILGVVLIAAVVSVVAVLAAANQTVSSNINVSYSVTDVAATVSARYYQRGHDITEAVPTAPGDGDTFEVIAGNKVKFTPDDVVAGGAFTIPAIELLSTENWVIFEYNFQNDAAKAFVVALTSSPAASNMTISYKVSATQLSTKTEWEADTWTVLGKDDVLADEVSAESALTLATTNSTVSVYIKAQITDLNVGASYGDGTSGFTWTLTA